MHGLHAAGVQSRPELVDTALVTEPRVIMERPLPTRGRFEVGGLGLQHMGASHHDHGHWQQGGSLTLQA